MSKVTVMLVYSLNECVGLKYDIENNIFTLRGLPLMFIMPGMIHFKLTDFYLGGLPVYELIPEDKNKISKPLTFFPELIPRMIGGGYE